MPPQEMSYQPPPQQSPLPTQDLPCLDCRRRKVRCSKTEPCFNCQRFSVECVYEDSSRLVSRRTPKSTDPLSKRVAELEDLVRNLSRRQQQGNPMETMTQNVLHKVSCQAATPEDGATEGKLVFDKDRSRYLHKGFWAAMYDEVGDLRFTLQAEPKLQDDAFFFPYTSGQSQPAVAHPSIPESDFLIQTFLDKVDPFVKILHKPTLQLELNHFRRSVCARSTEFECRLFTIYSLALLSMCSTLVEYRLHESKKVLLSRFRSYVEQVLSRVNLTTSHSLSTLQTFLLYITLLFWTGEMLHANSLLAVAIAMARRMGLNHDGTHFSLSPWQIELRRRLWHHLALLDAWCVENHGVQPILQPGDADTSLPQNQDDADWDTTEFASTRPKEHNKFTDMTLALMHYEVGALTMFVMNNTYTPSMTVRGYLDLQNEVLRQARDRLDILYARNLDETDILQKLAKDLMHQAFKRVRLIQLQPILNAKGIDEGQRAGLEAKVYHLAIDYCKSTQNLITFYTPYSLDWAVIRAFSWHSVATMLSMVLRHEALSTTPEARAASSRIERLFQNRPSIDYLAGNDNLWEPLRVLRAELAARERAVAAAAAAVAQNGVGVDVVGTAGSDAGTTDEWADLVSMTSTSIDPALFGLVGVGVCEGEDLGFETLPDLEAFT
ncbi:uncharacterized protein PV07_04447 [Cladophialophora immunda]|uniref:Zn(2)-C6 fungal-type domain-containing protein n=1 Tax=Cladophialophora immunda TaxID=569365 RepID=A0A0D1ZXW0_9EURO|nr:uncharacterized protein PV07_04447 [Cladophialophora immunda]KIW32936.1 hypothetical protein PV07_04447 [Cladophialophora immunda]